MPTPLEFKINKELPTTVDRTKKTEVQDLSLLKQELDGKKKEILAKKTADDAHKLLEEVPVYADASQRILLVGNVYITAPDDATFQTMLTTIDADVKEANKELAAFAEGKEKAIDDFQKEQADHKQDVNKTLVDKTFKNATLENDVKNTPFLQQVLSGKNGFETGLEEYHAAEEEAFKNQILRTLEEARRRYDAVKDTPGEVEFTLNEWYTLHFIDQHKNELSAKPKKIDWAALLYEYRQGLDGEGLPLERRGFVDPDNSVMNDGKEKTGLTAEPSKNKGSDNQALGGQPSVLEKVFIDNTNMKPVAEMTEQERQYYIDQAIEGIKRDGGLTIGTMPSGERKITLSQAQVTNFKRLNELQYVENIVNKSQDGALKKSAIERKIDRKNKKLQNSIIRGDMDQAADLSAELERLTQEQADRAKETDFHAGNAANNMARARYDMGAAAAASGLTGTIQKTGYTGITYEIPPYSPVFTNICSRISAIMPGWNGYGTINVGSRDDIIVECPEMNRQYVNKSFDGYINYASPVAYQAAGGQPNILERFFTDHTKMTPEQARRNSALLTTGALLTGAFFLGKWIIEGKKKGSKLNTLAKLGIVAGSVLGLNMLSQGFTGEGAGSLIRKLRSGEIKFNDLLKGKIGNETILGPQYAVGNQVLRNVPYSVLGLCCSPGANGELQIDLAKLETYVQQMLNATTDPTERAVLEMQLTAIRQTRSAGGANAIGGALTGMGVTYNELVNPNNANNTLNDRFDAVEGRKLALANYLADNRKELAVDGNTDADIQSFYTKGTPTINELEQKGKFKEKAPAAVEQNAEDITDPVLREANLPLEVKRQLQDGIKTLSDKIGFTYNSDRMRFASINGTLSLKSYDRFIPISYENGEYVVQNFGIRFTDASQALWVADLTNYIIKDRSGKLKKEAPFSASNYLGNADLQAGNNTFLKPLLNTDVVDGGWWKGTSTLRQNGGSGFQQSIELYANFLNGLKNKATNKSIWLEGNGVDDSRNIKDWFPAAPANNNGSANAATGGAPETLIPGRVEANERLSSEFAPEDIATGERWYTEFEHKDGGNSTGEEKVERNKRFFYIWARAFNNTEPSFTVDIKGADGKVKGITYERQEGHAAPRRASEKTEPRGYKYTVDKDAPIDG